ncbi:MAG: bifunctional enoyl-CoA hydratase/phosphate acetyltransferase [Candidatus Fermentibacteraceae bacterium]|nr:bifunctional enoyl-CoA hydratase/phosphate acetyltransferase [Candidatus Fermentibacteraceae bacterium]
MEPIRSLEQLKKHAKDLPSSVVSVVRADEVETLIAVKEAVEGGMVECILVGPEDGIKKAAAEADFDISNIRIVNAADDKESAAIGVELVRSGEAHVLMKGLVATSTFLKAVLNKEHGLRGKGLLSHVAAFDVPLYPKLLVITDAAMNIAPTIEQKKEMLENAVIVSRALGIEVPKCTFVCAKEVPYEKMPCTMEAAEMQKMADAGEFGDILFDGPLALDLAVSPVAVKIKKIESKVAGDADVILLPDIEAANVLYKGLIFLAGSELGAVVMGAKNPIVLTSRADSAESKLCSLVLSGVVAAYQGR